LDLSRAAYEQARKRLRNNYVFANEIANIYAQQGAWEDATAEFLREYYGNPQNLDKVNLDILNLVNPQSETAVEKALLSAIDKQNNDLGLRTILFEYYVLAENFYESFVQVKSIDRLFREDGNRVFKFAETMRNNKRYDLSNEAFDYIIDRKKNSPYFFRAHMEKAVNNELKAFEQIPVDLEAVKVAVDTYEGLFKEFGREVSYFNAIYRQANLRVFYLNEIERARTDLETIVQYRGLQPDEWAKAKLLIGDIQLMQKEYGNAKLTYTQITERFKSRQTGALAKYKLAQMAYYKGDFTESQARLGAIKDNTSNDISNDAIKLNLLIIDNTGLDTTTLPLEIFAQAQLLVYQRDYDDAMTLLDSLAEAYPTNGLTDEILWEKTQIYLKRNNIEKALEYIDRILANHKEDIYGDDALYTKARLYDYNLKDQEMAQKYYLDFLIEYPGSLFSVEVRKRIRQLRKEG
jgi:tetratricopeptide (TPR) repeat protein